jgi:hypothetical protein
MSEFIFFIDKESNHFFEEVRKNGNILCNFYLKIEQYYFPSKNWLDFPVIVLGWWLDGYRKLFEAKEPIINSLMNGPYGFTSQLIDSNSVKLCFFQRSRSGERELFTHILPIDEYKGSLIQAAEDLINVLEGRLAENKDVDQLKFILNEVRSLIL